MGRVGLAVLWSQHDRHPEACTPALAGWHGPDPGRCARRSAGEELKDAAVTRQDLESSQNALFWRVVAAVAVMLLAHLAAVWSIIGAVVKVT